MFPLDWIYHWSEVVDFMCTRKDCTWRIWLTLHLGSPIWTMKQGTHLSLYFEEYKKCPEAAFSRHQGTLYSNIYFFIFFIICSVIFISLELLVKLKWTLVVNSSIMDYIFYFLNKMHYFRNTKLVFSNKSL